MVQQRVDDGLEQFRVASGKDAHGDAVNGRLQFCGCCDNNQVDDNHFA